MFGDDTEDFNLFDDKQTAVLDAVDDKKEDEVTDDITDDTTDQSSTDDSVSDDTNADEGTADDDTVASDGEDTSETTDDAAKSDTTDESQGAPAGSQSDPTKQEEKEEKFATKDDIRAALAEQAAQQEARQTTRKNLRDELRSELFPDGIDVDLQIKDSDNGIITGPSQIAGKLINPNTNELFTYEEAKDYWDNAQKQIDRVIEEREQLIDLYAENNQSFFEGSQIVEQKYGAFLRANPDIAKQLLDNYLATAKVTKSGYITDMPLNVVAYYDTAMRPMLSVAKQMELNRQAEEARKVAEAEKQKANQSDRADLPVNNNNTPEKKKDSLTSAFDRYFEGR